jgi:hypothetical protein
MAQKMSETWGQQFIVENIPAGGGNVALGIVANRRPTATQWSRRPPASWSILALTKLPTTSSRISRRESGSSLSTCPDGQPERARQDRAGIYRAGESKPGKYSRLPGTGTTGQLAGEWFRVSHNLDMVRAVQRRRPGGDLDHRWTHPGHVLRAADREHRRQGGKIARARGDECQAHTDLPDVPTLAEAGVPGQESEFIQALLVPAGTPKEIVNQLAKETARIVNLPDVKEKLRAIGYVPVGSTPEEFAALIKTDIAKWEKVIREAGIKKIE